MKTLKYIASLLFAGFVVMCGLRAAEWLIPAPAMRIIVCYGNLGTTSVCMPLDEVKEIISDQQEVE